MPRSAKGLFMQRFSDNGRSPDHVDHKRWIADLIINQSLYRDKIYVYDSAIDLVKQVCQARQPSPVSTHSPCVSLSYLPLLPLLSPHLPFMLFANPFPQVSTNLNKFL